MVVLLIWGAVAHAGSLDQLEVGGAWGTPGATNPTAVWWNPAGLADARGTRALVEGAPTFGRVTAERTDPGYGPVDPALLPPNDAGEAPPAAVDYTGTDRAAFSGVVPFVGVATDLGLERLGLGLALSVPTAKGGVLDDPDGPNRFHLRDASIQTALASLGAAYKVHDRVSVGLSGSLAISSYYADTDVTTYPDLAAGQALLNDGQIPAGYQDGYAEQPDYDVRSIFDLRDTAVTFGAGVRIRPTGRDRLVLSLAYNHQVRLAHTGDARLEFDCPAAWDPQSRAIAFETGTCDRAAEGTASIAYRLPARLHAGLVIRPTETVRLEAMGGWVFWSAFGPYDIQPLFNPDQFDNRDADPGQTQTERREAAVRASAPRLWARDTTNSVWVGVDGKVEARPWLTVGGRVTFDQGAIAAQSVSANNYDADSVLLMGLVDLQVLDGLRLSVSYTRHVLARRTVTDSPFAVGADASRFDPAYFYPSANGVYTGSIDRLGITLRGQLP